MPDSLCRVNDTQPKNSTTAACERSHGRVRALPCARTAKIEAGTGARQGMVCLLRPGGPAASGKDVRRSRWPSGLTGRDEGRGVAVEDPIPIVCALSRSHPCSYSLDACSLAVLAVRANRSADDKNQESTADIDALLRDCEGCVTQSIIL